MKKLLTLLLTVTLVFSCIGCGSKEEDTSDAANVEAEVQTETGDDAQAEAESEEADAAQEPEAADETQSEDTTDVKSEGVMTYDEYVAADLESEVVVETYVQAKQSWWEDKATLYTQDKDGAYFVYNVACSEEDYAKLTPGTKIKVTGYKSEWSGEVEIIDGTFEIEEGNYVAAAEDVTALLGADELIDYQNRFVCFKGMTVEAAGQDESGNDVAFLYNWDGSGQDGDDLYFNVSLDGATYTFTVESYLCDNTTDVYNAVKALNIGDTIDMEGFLYWYEGVNPHITAVTPAN
ncbi:hypothetical protein IMSAG025_01067 [Muribaculaceae bacterium]|jgi:hypothetical protein|nr:hypothetical protein [Lachnospiraceae bacterium]GFI01478.1 hypothetical protein IMSAGC005_00301 [Lachnospiraceae bacterium]GFI57627.1 hypothetical protein IMSAG025_01067 [Muribaculaceae bacterium]